MIELKEGTFLVLENIGWGKNSGEYIRAQGEYQGKPRRVFSNHYGLMGWLCDLPLNILVGIGWYQFED
nr:MAG TPA: hypothetical protein [Ackermannviridae sp.]